MSEIKYCLECGSNDIVKRIYASGEGAVYCKSCKQEHFHSVRYANAKILAFDSVCSKLEKAIKALEFYGNVSNWRREGTLIANTILSKDCADYPHLSRDVRETGGKLARETLKEIRGEKCI